MSGATGASVPEGTPIVCRQCGGGMRPTDTTRVLCPFCGARDELPADEAARYLELKNRLALARARVAQVAGLEAALARIFEDRGAFLRVCGVYVAMAVLLTGLSCATLLTNPAVSGPGVSGAIRMQIYLAALSGPLLGFGLAGAFGLALLGGRIHFRRSVRPLLLARPIDLGETRLGCRACGAPLSASSDVTVTCRHCGSVNLIPAELHDTTTGALLRHAQQTARTVQGTGRRVLSVTSLMQWVLGIGIAATVLVAYVLPAALGRLLGAGGP